MLYVNDTKWFLDNMCRFTSNMLSPNISIVNVSISDKGEKQASKMAEGGNDIDDGTYFSNLLDQIDRETSSQR